MPLLRLTSPISGPTAVGEDLTFSTEFDAIAEARRADDPSLAQGEWTRALKVADWPLSLRLCETLLTEKSKDLRLAGWYTEARTQLHGFRGLTEGLSVVAGLCETFWDDLHPSGDNDERAGCLRWLVTQCLEWLRHMPLDKSGEMTLSTLLPARGARPEESVTQLSRWRLETDTAHRAALRTTIETTFDVLRHLDEVMQKNLGDDAPSTTAVAEALDNLIGLMSPPVHTPAASEPPSSAPRHLSPSVPLIHPPASGNRFANRPEALQALREVAAFFRATEPHSPVAYLADKAAHWGDMPLHIWLEAVLGEGDSLRRMRDLLDIPVGQAKQPAAAPSPSAAPPPASTPASAPRSASTTTILAAYKDEDGTRSLNDRG